jgi:hypothetical protein
MPRNNPAFRATAVILLAAFLQIAIFSAPARAQAPDCPYDKANPSLDNARINFKSLNYRCAELEIQDYLNLESLNTSQKADAHVLLAAVYYAKSKNEDEKRSLVIDQFKEAFRAYREWRGELDISSTEFIDMMNQAKAQVDKEATEVKVTPITKIEETKPESKKKAWYKKWWALGLGIGVVAGVVVIASGGGGDEGDGNGNGTPTDTLPSFPTTPPK